MYTVYILQSRKTGRYYTGSTQNLDNRLAEHNSGETSSTRPSIPWEVIHTEQLPTRSEAIRKEREIKARVAARYLKDLRQNEPG